MEHTKKKNKKMITSDIIINILDKNNIKHVFGIPGNQILPLYKSLEKSTIKHVLTRHEQGAIHASDGYARSIGKFSVCISTAGPGAMNLVMGVATAYKDSVPLLIITGDNDYPINYNNFQSIKTNDVFKSITVKSFQPEDGITAIKNLNEAIEILNYEASGPVHLNISRNVLLENIEYDFELKKEIKKYDKNILGNIKQKIKISEKPLVIVGGGCCWSQCEEELNEFLKKNNIPSVSTFHGKGVISEYEKLNLGILGIRGNTLTKYAFNESDLIISLGCKLSDRTLGENDNTDSFKDKLISINLDSSYLVGLGLDMDVKEFLNIINEETYLKNDKWLDEIYLNETNYTIDGVDDNSLPLRPPFIINNILSKKKDDIIISDAGSHTTWTFLLTKNSKPRRLLFSGGFGPMGYGVPAGIGASFANPKDKVFVINGDGDFQMNLQELSTIKEHNLNICIFILNNSELGIIRQWEELNNMNPYQVDLNCNPDFKKLGESYNIKSFKVENDSELDYVLDYIENNDGPVIVDVLTRIEDIPLPSKLF